MTSYGRQNNVVCILGVRKFILYVTIVNIIFTSLFYRFKKSNFIYQQQQQQQQQQQKCNQNVNKWGEIVTRAEEMR